MTYAYWQINKNQTGENVVNTACLKLKLDNEQNNINLPKAYPISDEEGHNLTPYSFTITNECNDSEDFTIGLEMLNETTLDSKYVKYYLGEIKEKYVLGVDYGDGDFDEWSYNDEEECLSDKDWALEENYTITKSCQLEEVEEEIKTNKLDKEKESENLILKNEAKEGRRLLSDVIKGHESKKFALRLWIDYDADIGSTSKIFKSKVVLTADMMEKGVLRKINGYYPGSLDTEGMWGYKSKLTKIIIENKLSKKEGTVVHGPFDESREEDNSIQSYVVCEEKDANCIGYLQGNGKIKLNKDSSNLFSEFSKVTEIEGIENLDTTGVTNMLNMFYKMSSLQRLDLSKGNFDTSSVTSSMCQMFSGMSALQELNLGSNFDTSNVIEMQYMFSEMSTIQELDLGSKFDTSNVIDMDFMFSEDINLTTINYGPSFIHKEGANTSGMFYNCKPELTRPTHDSWND